jgi:uncharacterized membrane protein (DUF4010 family)
VTAAVTLMAASTIMFPRVLLEAWVLNAPLAQALAPPIAVATAIGLVAAYLTNRLPDGTTDTTQAMGNPLNFRLALQFALVYMAVRLLVAYAMDRHGAAGTYVAAVLSGTTDMDAITLSLARSSREGGLEVARNAVLLAGASNTLFKLGIALVLADRKVVRLVAIGLGAALVGGAITTLLMS